MADNLEQYFRNKLTEETPASDDWNVPSDQVWEKVMPEIQSKEGVFISWKAIYLSAILLAILLAILWWLLKPGGSIVMQQDIQMTEEVNEKVPASTPPANADIPLSENGRYEQDAGQVKPAGEEEMVLPTGSQDTVIRSREEKMDTHAAGEEDQQSAGNNQPITVTVAHTEREAYPAVRPLNMPGIHSMNSQTTAMVDENERVSLHERTSHVVNQKPSDPEINNAPVMNKGKFAIGAYFAPTFNNTKVTGGSSQDYIETGNMLKYSSNWGFEFKYFLSNRFTLVTGIGKSEIRSWSQSTTDFGYDPTTEQNMPDGDKMNTSGIKMHTPFGMVDTEVTYKFPGDVVLPSGETMNSVQETHMDVRYLSIPLGAEFNIIRFSRFNWIAEAGLRYNRAMRDATEFSSRILHEGNDMDIVNESITGTADYKLNYLSFYMGTGLNYQFRGPVQVGVSTRYFGNLTPVNTYNNMSTYMQGFDFKIGLIYIF